jgi:hypothetical protein
MQRIRIDRKPPSRADRGWYDVLPLDPRDPDVLRAKLSPPRGETDRSSRIDRRT